MNTCDPRAFDWALKTYWDYYIELEDELLRTRRYVAFSESNFNTYSIEFLKLYEAACSEVDVLLKVLAKRKDGSFDSGSSTSIHKCWYVVQDFYSYSHELRRTDVNGYPFFTSSLNDATVRAAETIVLRPWENYSVEQYKDKRGNVRHRLKNGMNTPRWWSDYNKVKHSRVAPLGSDQDDNFHRAKLGNVLYAFAGLYILEKALLRTIGSENDHESFIDNSVLFTERDRALTQRDIDGIVRRYRRRQ